MSEVMWRMIGHNHFSNTPLNPHGHLSLVFYHVLPRKAIESYLFSAVPDSKALFSGHRLTPGATDSNCSL